MPEPNGKLTRGTNTRKEVHANEYCNFERVFAPFELQYGRIG